MKESSVFSSDIYFNMFVCNIPIFEFLKLVGSKHTVSDKKIVLLLAIFKS
jgi:hypothetical protein